MTEFLLFEASAMVINLRTASYTTDRLNRYAQRTVPGAADILGIANPTGSVTVNGNTAYRKGEYFHYALPIGNTSAAQYPLVTVASTYPPGRQDSGNVFLPKTPEQFGYDADGNLTSDGRWNYTWDAENRLIRLVANTTVGPQQRIDFNYDWQSRRIAKTVWNNTDGTGNPAVLKKFLYDAWTLLGEIDALNPQPTTLIRSYIWGSDLSGSMQGAGGVGGLLMVWDLATINGQPSTHFVAYDGNGNVAGLLNSQGATASATYEYGPFGELIRSTGPLADANPVRFSSKYQDPEDDLLYYGYRYYGTSAGRWMNRDPYAEHGALNLYEFGANDAVLRIDARGQIPLLPIGIGIGLGLLAGCSREADCVCTKVQFGTPDQQADGDFTPTPVNPLKPKVKGIVNIGVKMPYTIEIRGRDPSKCHCQYQDSGNVTFAVQGFQPGVSPQNRTYDRECTSGYDRPGPFMDAGEHGSISYTLSYDLTVKIICTGSDKTKPPVEDSRKVPVGPFSSTYRW